MSDLNNKHLPSDIDSLTRRDLVELWLIQFEEHKNMIAEIESLRTQLATTKPEWISVEDSLPKSETTKYIVMFSLFYAPSYIDTSVFVDGKWSITKEDPRLGRVTHWMPLPPPPTQED